MVTVMVMTATDAAAAAAAVNHFKQKLLFGHFSIKKSRATSLQTKTEKEATESLRL